MMNEVRRNVVTVTIAGEEYTVRSDADPEYTLECAAEVDRAIAEVLGQGRLVEAHKAAMLAAMSLADRLFQARAEVRALQQESAAVAARLTADVVAAMRA
jgi:cell division protein ZapA